MGLNRNLGQLTEVITEGGGNIGIGGTPNAGFRVDVNGTGRFSGDLTGNGIINANFSGGNIKLGGATTDAGLVVSGSKLYLGDWATLLKGLVVDLSSGNVGIGTTSPTVRLDISDNAPSGATRIRATNSSTSIFSSAALELFSHNGSSVSAGTSLFSTNNNFNYGTIISNQTNLYGVRSGGIRIATGVSPIVFSNGNLDIDFATERMRINSSGNVSIGTTTDTGDRLYVSGRMSAQNFRRIQIVLQPSPQSLGLPINANHGGGAYLLLISTHWDAGNSTSANLWMIRCGYSGNNFEAVAISNMNSSAAISFSQINGILHIAGNTNWVANIQVVSNNILS
jgi:hypothetical protein